MFSVLAPLVLAGCGDDISQLLQPGDGNELSAEGQEFLLTVGALNAVTEFQKLHDVSAAGYLRLIALRDNVWTFGFGASGQCSPSPSNSTDEDQDGILDDAVLTFTAANCTLDRNQQPGSVTGTVRVQDLPGAWALRLTYDDLRITFATADTTDTIVLDGVAEVHLDANGASTRNQVTTQLSASAPHGTVTLSFANDLTTQFTPSSAALDPSLPPPAGAFAVTGTIRFTASVSGSVTLPSELGSGSYTAEISTPNALQYSGSCSAASLFFSGGSIRMLIRGVADADITADWPPCSANGPQVKR